MTPQELKEAFDACRACLDKQFPEWEPVELDEGMKRGSDFKPRFDFAPGDIGHLKFMCEKAKQFADQGRHEKANRWLGFVQGSLWFLGLTSINKLKNINKPKEEL